MRRTRLTHRIDTLRILVPFAFALLAGGCASTSTPLEGTNSQEAAQHAFFPDRYHYTVGDFVLSLPVGYYEHAATRLKFAEHILAEGTPKPAKDQERYLTLPSDGLAPVRHFLLLDQHHLLIYSEAMSLDGGHPPSLEILRRTSDASWTNVTKHAVPKGAAIPKKVAFAPDYTYVGVVGDGHTSRKLRWNGRQLIELE